ncbi:MAG: aromatic-ring-hydroxylating dioxygenase subunit beta [Ilumatobacteraceae bacterium]
MTVIGATARARVPWSDIAADDVRDLYDDYAILLDQSDYDAWLELFVEDATYMVVALENVERGLPLATMRCDSRAMLADRINAIVNTQFFARRLTRHLITAVRPVRTEPGSVETTANFVVVETLVDEMSTLHSAGSYADRIVRTEHGPRFAMKSAIYDAPLVPTSLIVPL